MASALRTMVVAQDRRYLRALTRLLEGESAVQVCGVADDLETAATIARAVHADLVLLDARMSGVTQAVWPNGAKRIFLVAEGDNAPAVRATGEACVSPERLAGELQAALSAFRGS